jgi:Ca-activated chloride channel homolog
MTFMTPVMLLVGGGVVLVYALFAMVYIQGVSQRLDQISGDAQVHVYPLSLNKAKLKAFLHFVTLLFLMVALARPIMTKSVENVEVSKLDIVMALDISPSMLAEDIRPNRLERAKREMNSLLNRLPGYRLGLVIFSGAAFQQLPLTVDYSAFKLLLANLNTESISYKGTDLSDALSVSIKSFAGSDDNHKKVVLLLTDGEDHSQSLWSVVDLAKKKGVIVYPIGIGSKEGAPIPIIGNDGNREGFKTDKEGRTVVSKLRGDTLNKIADKTGGKSYKVNQASFDLPRIVNHIVSLESEKVTVEMERQVSKELYPYFLLPAILLLIITTSLSNIKRVVSLMLLFGMMGQVSHAKSFNFSQWYHNRQGFKALSGQNPDKGIKHLLKGVGGDYENPLLHYNLGNGLAVAGKMDEAKKEWDQATQKGGNKQLESFVDYNKGLAYLAAQDLEKAKASFIEALKSNPMDLNAKKNLEMVQVKISKQEQQQPQQEPAPNEDDDQKDEEEKEGKGQQGEFSEEEAENILDQLKDDKLFSPSEEKSTPKIQNDW